MSSTPFIGRIYKIVCDLDPELLYVGSTIQTLRERMGGHISSVKNEIDKSFVHAKMHELGTDHFSIHLLEESSFESMRELNKTEQKWIDELAPNLNGKRAYGDSRKLRSKKKVKVKTKPSHFECKICLKTIPVDQLHEHACSHDKYACPRFCPMCLHFTGTKQHRDDHLPGCVNRISCNVSRYHEEGLKKLSSCLPDCEAVKFNELGERKKLELDIGDIKEDVEEIKQRQERFEKTLESLDTTLKEIKKALSIGPELFSALQRVKMNTSDLILEQKQLRESIIRLHGKASFPDSHTREM